MRKCKFVLFTAEPILMIFCANTDGTLKTFIGYIRGREVWGVGTVQMRNHNLGT